MAAQPQHPIHFVACAWTVMTSISLSVSCCCLISLSLSLLLLLFYLSLSLSNSISVFLLSYSFSLSLSLSLSLLTTPSLETSPRPTRRGPSQGNPDNEQPAAVLSYGASNAAFHQQFPNIPLSEHLVGGMAYRSIIDSVLPPLLSLSLSSLLSIMCALSCSLELFSLSLSVH